MAAVGRTRYVRPAGPRGGSSSSEEEEEAGPAREELKAGTAAAQERGFLLRDRGGLLRKASREEGRGAGAGPRVRAWSLRPGLARA